MIHRVQSIRFWPFRGILKVLVPAKWVAKNGFVILKALLSTSLKYCCASCTRITIIIIFVNCNKHLIYGMSIYRKSLNNLRAILCERNINRVAALIAAIPPSPLCSDRFIKKLWRIYQNYCIEIYCFTPYRVSMCLNCISIIYGYKNIIE